MEEWEGTVFMMPIRIYRSTETDIRNISPIDIIPIEIILLKILSQDIFGQSMYIILLDLVKVHLKEI